MKRTYLVFLKQNFKQNVLFCVTNYKTSYGETEWQNWQPFKRAALPKTPRGWGQAVHSALPAAAPRLAVRYKASLLMAWAGFHKSPIQDRSHLLKPQGQYLVRWLWYPGYPQRAGKYDTGHRRCCALLGRQWEAGDLIYSIQNDARWLCFGSKGLYLVVIDNQTTPSKTEKEKYALDSTTYLRSPVISLVLILLPFARKRSGPKYLPMISYIYLFLTEIKKKIIFPAQVFICIWKMPYSPGAFLHLFTPKISICISIPLGGDTFV